VIPGKIRKFFFFFFLLQWPEVLFLFGTLAAHPINRMALVANRPWRTTVFEPGFPHEPWLAPCG